jgi:hypothetical protein
VAQFVGEMAWFLFASAFQFVGEVAAFLFALAFVLAF